LGDKKGICPVNYPMTSVTNGSLLKAFPSKVISRKMGQLNITESLADCVEMDKHIKFSCPLID